MRAVIHFALLVILVTPCDAAQSQVPGTQTPQAPGPPRPGQPPRDLQQPPKTGTARIKGRVVSVEGLPLRRAVVRAAGQELREGRSTTTDAQGVYELKELPAGRYTLIASKGSYVTMQLGQRRPFEAGRPMEIADGQVFEKADFTLPKGSVIAGRVVDEFGEPVADAMVQAMRYQYTGGQRRLMPAGRSGSTNDLGQFRIFGLPPGDFYVSATLRSGMFMMGESDSNVGYAPTYYPGTPSAGEALRVSLAVGQEQSGVDFGLIPTRTARITGTATDSRGKPLANAMLMVVQSIGTGGFMSTSGGMIRPDGTFTIPSVSPGEYTLSVQPRNFGDEDFESATVPITVTGEDITGLSILTSPGVRASGQIIFEGNAPPATTSAAMIGAQPAEPFNAMPMRTPVRIHDDWTFEPKNLQGKRIVRVMGLTGWTLKSISLGGTDVTDTPIEFKGTDDVTGIQVRMTSQITEISGTVADGRGRPARDYVVVAFVDDSSKWGWMTHYVRTGRPDQDGVFKVRELPPGEYLLAALEYLGEGEWQDPEVLERLKATATRATLVEGERKSVMLKLSVGS